MVKVVKKASYATALFRILALSCFVVIVFVVVMWQILPSVIPSRMFIDKSIYQNVDAISTYDKNTLKVLTEQLVDASKKLRGDDHRLVQWDATEETAKAQPTVCPTALPIAANFLVSSSYQYIFQFQNEKDLVQAALDVCIFCITDNPTNRATFAETANVTANNTIHGAIVGLLQVGNFAPMAAHLIYIATFANSRNHAGFVQANAVSVLSNIVLSEHGHDKKTSNTPPISTMWAMAALQNLAASYCTTPDDGRCYWEWKRPSKSSFEYALQISDDSGSMIIDGEPVRQAIASSTNLVHQLVQWSCRGPVQGKMSSKNPFPGKNARSDVVHEHEWSENILPWAATGALKNLVLDPEIRSIILSDYAQSMSCFCYMSQSKDWLEANKGEGVLHHLRVDSDPCWFDFYGRHRDGEEEVLCVDRVFVDTVGNTCEEYNGENILTKEDCTRQDHRKTIGIFAKTACCQCGGGDQYSGP
jgi:hypothetical protein